MEHPPLTSLLLLARTPGLSARLLRAATAACADPIETLLAGSLRPHTRAALEQPDRQRLEADLRWVAAHDCRVLASTDPGYPSCLLDLPDAPAVLFVRGDAALLARPQLAVVGARAATHTGRVIAREFAAALARAGLTITSGLAVGIDAAAHEGAVEAGGCSIAVFAQGLDRIYPRQHRSLAERICGSGALVSERPPGTALRPGLFPRRNRLIAALCQATVVVEAAPESGSLGTARAASALGRRVFAVPGCIRSRLSAGCHQLIRSGATLAASADEILCDLGIPKGNQGTRVAVAPPADTSAAGESLDKAAEMLLDAAGFEPVGIDFLVERTGLSGPVVASLLLVLELRGRVAPHPGGRYCRLA
jgi:DNA processing protein